MNRTCTLRFTPLKVGVITNLIYLNIDNSISMPKQGLIKSACTCACLNMGYISLLRLRFSFLYSKAKTSFSFTLC